MPQIESPESLQKKMKETLKTFLIVKKNKKIKGFKVSFETYHPKPSRSRNLQKKVKKETLINVSNKINKKEVKVYLRNSPRTDPKSNSTLKSTKETREMLTFLKKK